MSAFRQIFARVKSILIDNVYVSVATTVFLTISFFFIPTWLSGIIEHRYGFVVALILLVASGENTHRLAKVKKVKGEADEL